MGDLWLWFTICMGDEVEDRLVVPHDEVNGQWELQGSINKISWGTWDI